MDLTNRERYIRLFNGEPVDHAPFLDIMGFWPSTIQRWRGEGLNVPEDASFGEVARKARY